MPTSSPALSRRTVLSPAAAGGLVATLWAAPAVVSGAAAPPSVLRVGRREMGTLVEVLLPAGDDPADALRALDLVSDVARRFTVFDEASEVSSLNRAAARHPVPIEADLFHLLHRAVVISRDTGGAFDVATGALWRAWGFMGDRPGPQPTSVDAARWRSGCEHVVLDSERSTVAFTSPGLEVNLGAIGKGHAIDRACAALVAAGHTRALVHAGFSSLRAWGDAPGAPSGGGWPVSIRRPMHGDRPLATVRLRDHSMGISGSGERYLDRDSTRVGHVIDPRTGVSAAHHALAVAWAADATTADALSTAFFVMTGEDIEAYCACHPDVGALVVPAPPGEGDVATIGAVPPTLAVAR